MRPFARSSAGSAALLVLLLLVLLALRVLASAALLATLLPARLALLVLLLLLLVLVPLHVAALALLVLLAVLVLVLVLCHSVLLMNDWMRPSTWRPQDQCRDPSCGVMGDDRPRNAGAVNVRTFLASERIEGVGNRIGEFGMFCVDA